MLVCGVNVINVLFRTISASMGVIKAPMMMGFRCVCCCVMLIFCVNVLFIRMIMVNLNFFCIQNRRTAPTWRNQS